VVLRQPDAPVILENLIDTLTLTGGRAAALQTGLLPGAAVEAPGWLYRFSEGYFRYLGTLPLLAATRSATGAHRLGVVFMPPELALLRFAPPYLAAKRGGRELRYAIVGGLMTRGASGFIAFGHAPEGGQARIWVEVLEFWPRLGLGPLYVLTEVVLHRIITVRYMRHWQRLVESA
jgi:hypothetical protein